VILEIFDHPATFARQWDRLIQGLLLDTLRSRNVTTPGRHARTFVGRAGGQRLAAVQPGGAGGRGEARDDLVDARALCRPDGRRGHYAAVNARHEALLAA
jgi:hypothetical protein